MLILPQISLLFKNGRVTRAKIVAGFCPGQLYLFIFHCLTDFFTKQALDFVLHRLRTGGAEMRPYPVSSFADFLHQRGRGLRRGLGVGDGFGGSRFVTHSSPFSVEVC